MHQIPPAFMLMPQQFRLINATEGFRLEVCSGCLWLTRPGDAVDRFLVAGAAIDLHENHVLIQSDRHPGASSGVSARYVLVPLCAPSVGRKNRFFQRLASRVWSRLQGIAEVSASATCPTASPRKTHGRAKVMTGCAGLKSRSP
jgi:hypothetical protein